MLRGRFAGCAVLVLCGVLGIARGEEDPNLIAPTEPLSPAEQIKLFRLPPGFEIQLIVADPEIGQPTNIHFDAKGRLWINSTLEYPYPASGEGRDRLCYMDDSDGNGVPDRIHTFAEGLNIPIGVARVHDAVVAYSIPSIDRFSDTDHDGKADQRDTLFKGFGFRDTHGMASSFRPWIDGWIYACHGFANDSIIEGRDQPPVSMNSGNTYRFRADGSRFEQWTWGQVNPFGLAFDPWGNLFSADCHTKPAFMLLRGAYYDSFGKPNDGLGFGPEMIDHFHGSTGIAGIVYYDAQLLPNEFYGNLLIGNPVTGRINRDRLEWHGSSPKAIEMPDLVSCDDRWFRPVDITLAPDGSLYIADFYNCIIGHYEVRLEHPRRDRHRGRIWRLVYVGEDKSSRKPAPMKDMTAADVDTLIGLLGNANIMVRVLATNELVDRVGPAALAPARKTISSTTSAEQRVHLLWVIERLGGLTSVEIDALAKDASPLVRTHLVRAIGTRQPLGEVRAVILDRLTNDESPFVVRAAAEALGWQPDAANLQPLLDAWRAAAAEDTHRIHQIRIALRNNLRDLGQLEVAFRHLRGDDVVDRLLDVSLGIANQDSASFVLQVLHDSSSKQPRESALFQHACRHIDESKLSELYRTARQNASEDQGRQQDILRGLYRGAQARGKSLPPEVATWVADVARSMLGSNDAKQCRAGLEFARELKPVELASLIDALASPGSAHLECRPPAMETLAALDPGTAVRRFSEVIRSESDSIDLKKQAADLLGRLKVAEGTEVLSAALAVAPADFASSLARGLSWSDHGGDVLLRMIEQGKAAPQLLNDPVVASEIGARVFDRKDERLAKIRQSIVSPDETLRQIVADRRAGFTGTQTDVARGRGLFEKNCANCHQIAGAGAKIGPQLDGIGIRGIDRLLEDTLDPDRNVDQAFRRKDLVLTDGRIISGIVLRVEGAVLIVADAMGKEIRIPESEIEQQQESNLSPMPTDVARALPPSDLYDLLAYLLTQRQAATN